MTFKIALISNEASTKTFLPNHTYIYNQTAFLLSVIVRNISISAFKRKQLIIISITVTNFFSRDHLIDSYFFYETRPKLHFIPVHHPFHLQVHTFYHFSNECADC